MGNESSYHWQVDEKQVQIVPSPFRKGRLRGILSLEIPLNPPFSKREMTKEGFLVPCQKIKKGVIEGRSPLSQN